METYHQQPIYSTSANALHRFLWNLAQSSSKAASAQYRAVMVKMRIFECVVCSAVSKFRTRSLSLRIMTTLRGRCRNIAKTPTMSPSRKTAARIASFSDGDCACISRRLPARRISVEALGSSLPQAPSRDARPVIAVWKIGYCSGVSERTVTSSACEHKPVQVACRLAQRTAVSARGWQEWRVGSVPTTCGSNSEQAPRLGQSIVL